MDLDYIKQETERQKKEKKYVIEAWETEKTQFKMKIVKGKEEELKVETKASVMHCGKKTRKKHNIKK